MESLPTGIKGLDLLIDGGYPRGKSIMVTGPPGSGKTILGLHFLHMTCANGGKCMLVLTRELTEDIIFQSKSLGIDLEPFLKNGQLNIRNIFEDKINKLKSASRFGKGLCAVDTDIIEYLNAMSSEVNAVVIDNLGMMAIDHDIRDFADQFSSISIILMKNGCTSLFIMDQDSYEITHKLTGYMVFGLIRLTVQEKLTEGRTRQYLYIEKMRSKPVPVKYSLFDIGPEGIRIINGIK